MLKVKHVIVCGHYGCSGVQAALGGKRIGLSDNWLRHVSGCARKTLNPCWREFRTGPSRLAKLCELNVIEQVVNVAQTTIMREARERGQELTVHGWIYGLKDGFLP